jgi:hypothetical protein
VAYHSEDDKLLLIPSKFSWIPTGGLLGSAYNHSHWKKWTVPIPGSPPHIVQLMTQPQRELARRQQLELERQQQLLQ